MTHPPEMIGRIGEAAVDIWAAQACMTANGSMNDDKGWDFILQLPSSAERPVGPLDRHPPELSCMVQVKTTLGHDNSVDIRLSNWRRMCVDPIPWFVLVVRADPILLEPVAAFLVHIDEKWCGKVLKRLRECSVPQHQDLNEKWLALNWTEDNALKQLHGRELARLIRCYVPDQMLHILEKRGWVENLGYEDRARHIEVTVGAADRGTLFSQLAELAVGQRATFPRNWNARVSDVRFGISATLQEVDWTSGDMEFHAPPQGLAKLRIQDSNSARAVELICDVYRAQAVFPFLPTEYDCIRLVSTDVSVFVSPRFFDEERVLYASIKFAIPADLVSLSRLKSLIDLGYLVTCSDQIGLSLTLVVGNQEASLSSGMFGTAQEEQRELVSRLDAAISVCRHFAVPENTVVSPESLSAQGQWAVFMASVLESNADGELIGAYPEPIQTGSTYGMLYEAGLQLPDRTLILFLGCYGSVTECRAIPDKGASIRVGQGHMLVQRLSLDATTEDWDFAMSTERERMRQTLISKGCDYISDAEMLGKMAAATA